MSEHATQLCANIYWNRHIPKVDMETVARQKFREWKTGSEAKILLSRQIKSGIN